MKIRKIRTNVGTMTPFMEFMLKNHPIIAQKWVNGIDRKKADPEPQDWHSINQQKKRRFKMRH